MLDIKYMNIYFDKTTWTQQISEENIEKCVFNGQANRKGQPPLP